MNVPRPVVIALGLVLTGQIASAQDLSRYRGYALESSLASIIMASGARAGDAKTLHQRPATVQELEWRAPYVRYGDTLADPVRRVAFTFYNDALYQVIVYYDRDRTEGLTADDIIASLSAAYGAPVLASTRVVTSPPTAGVADRAVLARWDSAESAMTLVRGAYSPEFQLILLSKPLGSRARAAIAEAISLDALEAPRREAAQREKAADDASAARDKTRTTNKGAFRP